jgi:hypothetical protein
MLVIFFSAMAAIVYKRRRRRNNSAAKVELAKASFRVRKSSLMSISGYGVRRKTKKTKQLQQRINREQILLIRGECNHAASSRYERLRAFFMQMTAVSLGSLKLRDVNASSDTTTEPSQDKHRQPKRNNKKKERTILEGYYDNFQVVGLDCEMVGGGRSGLKSLLARCSVVTLDCIPPNAAAPTASKDGQQQQQTLTSLNQNLIVLYDKYVIPKEKITDYRTEWSGITKRTYSNNNSQSIPIVSFQTCQNEITQLFSSISNKKVMVVGHAIENDFDALGLSHPISLVRDTAFFIPYMRQVRTRMFSRKLSVLSSEELGIDIQQRQQTLVDPPSLQSEEEEEGESVGVSLQNESRVGHSSVEDAAAALRLYWHKCIEWEHSLGYPLSTEAAAAEIASEWNPLNMFLDGCNLPVAMRGVDFRELFAYPPHNNSSMTDKPMSFSITSRIRDDSNVHTIDWMPVFVSALHPNSTLKLDCISILFDGAKYRDIIKSSIDKKQHQSPRVFCSDLSRSIIVEITKDGDSVDDVLFERLCFINDAVGANAESNHRRIIPLTKVMDILSFDTNQTGAKVNDSLSHYVIVRRKGGGSKTHRRLFDKLHLRRPCEGALCLSGLTNKLNRHSWKIARDLQREKGIEKVIECELRRRQDLQYLVVTDDVFLTERLIRSHAVMVLKFMQFSNMF